MLGHGSLICSSAGNGSYRCLFTLAVSAEAGWDIPILSAGFAKFLKFRHLVSEKIFWNAYEADRHPRPVLDTSPMSYGLELRLLLGLVSVLGDPSMYLSGRLGDCACPPSLEAAYDNTRRGP